MLWDSFTPLTKQHFMMSWKWELYMCLQTITENLTINSFYIWCSTLTMNKHFFYYSNVGGHTWIIKLFAFTTTQNLTFADVYMVCVWSVNSGNNLNQIYKWKSIHSCKNKNLHVTSSITHDSSTSSSLYSYVIFIYKSTFTGWAQALKSKQKGC